MRRLLFSVLLLTGLACLGPLPAAAQIRDGLYSAEGTNPDGSNYTGSLVIQAAPNGTWFAVWQVGETRIQGVGVINGGVLTFGYAVNGNPGVAAYAVDADGKLRGIWTVGGGMGTEILTPR